jgi:hypothetical protein
MELRRRERREITGTKGPWQGIKCLAFNCSPSLNGIQLSSRLRNNVQKVGIQERKVCVCVYVILHTLQKSGGRVLFPRGLPYSSYSSKVSLRRSLYSFRASEDNIGIDILAKMNQVQL